MYHILFESFTNASQIINKPLIRMVLMFQFVEFRFALCLFFLPAVKKTFTSFSYSNNIFKIIQRTNSKLEKEFHFYHTVSILQKLLQ